MGQMDPGLAPNNRRASNNSRGTAESATASFVGAGEEQGELGSELRVNHH